MLDVDSFAFATPETVLCQRSKSSTVGRPPPQRRL